MNANELADELNRKLSGRLIGFTAAMLRQQAEQINNLQQWQRRQLDVIEAQKKVIEEQDKKIIELAFRTVYAERSNEVVKELSK